MSDPDIRQFGPYQILGTVGGGAMGTVFQARHRFLRRRAIPKADRWT